MNPRGRGILVKLDPQGGVQWSKGYYVSSSEEVSLAVAAETETGYVVVGESEATRTAAAFGSCKQILEAGKSYGNGGSHRVEDAFWAGAARRPL
ncbi:MAG: hypothetical protein N3A55_04235 [Methylohalobius sp.]|nr:hypothetical protein [Methylohalobius sp.]